MKKFFSDHLASLYCILSVAFCFTFQSCQTGRGFSATENKHYNLVPTDKYEFILLGDLHYDDKECHDDNVTDSKRKQEHQRNLAHWRYVAPRILRAAASQVDDNTLMVVQLGDITQGDTKSQEAQSDLLAGAMANVIRAFKDDVPFFIVKGNHDYRAPGKGAAFAETVEPYIQRQLPPGAKMSGANYVFSHGPDVFIFVDCQAPDYAFIKEAIDSHQQARHIFLIDHIPVCPYRAQNGKWYKWVMFGPQNSENIELRRNLLELLATNNTIVLAGHVHDNSLIKFQNDNGNITQITVSSMTVTSRHFPTMQGGIPPRVVKNLIKSDPDFYGDYLPYIKAYERTGDGGYAIVKIDGTYVEINYYHGFSQNPAFRWRLSE